MKRFWLLNVLESVPQDLSLEPVGGWRQNRRRHLQEWIKSSTVKKSVNVSSTILFFDKRDAF